MKKRHRLKLIGITYNQIESGVYAVILEEVNGDRRIPIVIGYAEAQAIECKLQEVKTPRPLTHDLMKSILDSFGLKLSVVEIYKMRNGVFAARLIIEGQDGEMKIVDSRSSDALALAIRCNTPIYTSSEVLDEAGFRPLSQRSQQKEEMSREEKLLRGIDTSSGLISGIESFDSLEAYICNDQVDPTDVDKEILEFLTNFTDSEIEMQISKYASDEKYEVAARLKSLLNKRKSQRPEM